MFVLANEFEKPIILEPLDRGVYETELGKGTYRVDAVFPGFRSCGPYTIPVRANRISEVDMLLRCAPPSSGTGLSLHER